MICKFVANCLLWLAANSYTDLRWSWLLVCDPAGFHLTTCWCTFTNWEGTSSGGVFAFFWKALVGSKHGGPRVQNPQSIIIIDNIKIRYEVLCSSQNYSLTIPLQLQNNLTIENFNHQTFNMRFSQTIYMALLACSIVAALPNPSESMKEKVNPS